MAPVEETHEFRNTTTGYVGAIKIDRRGERNAVALAPGETIELTVEEEEATARAHKDPADNPFTDQDYAIRDPQTNEVVESGRRPPLELVTEKRELGSSRRPIGSQRSEEVGAAPEPDGEPATGEYASGEEVGTPLKGAEAIGVRTESG